MQEDRKTTTMFIGGIPPQMTKAELAELLKDFNPMKIDLKKRSGRKTNRGYAFLALDDAQKAEELSKRHFIIQGRTIQVQYSLKGADE